MNHNIGSISHGTMKLEDLIPTFIDCLEAQDDVSQAHMTLYQNIQARMELAEDYWETECAGWDLAELFGALNEYAPPYCYFGAIEGDGSDYGFWPSWDAIDESIHTDDMLKVADLSEIPTDYSGDVLLVNDHGNTSLYCVTDAKCVEIWAIV